MRFVRCMPMEDPAVTEALKVSGMKRLREPKNSTAAILMSMPIAFVLGALEVALLLWLSPDLLSGFSDGGIAIAIDLRIIAGIAGIWASALLHEVIHVLAMPKPFGDKTYLGLRSGFGFCGMEGGVSRPRFMLISFMPLLVISVLLPVLMTVCSGFGLYFALLFVINAMGSCVDVLNVLLVLFQTKHGQRLELNGTATFFG